LLLILLPFSILPNIILLGYCIIVFQLADLIILIINTINVSCFYELLRYNLSY
jgi:hypothetical protein